MEETSNKSLLETEKPFEIDLVSDSNLTQKQQQELKELLEKYKSIFVPTERNPGRIQG